MAFDGHLHKIVIGGKLAQTETWSCSWHALTTQADTILIAGPLMDAFNSWFGNVESLMQPFATLDYVKANELNPNPVANTGGKPISPAYTRYLYQGSSNEVYLSPGTQPAGGMTNAAPQNTLAISTSTIYNRGPAHAGRFYPPMSPTVSSDGRIQVTDQTKAATAAAAMIKAVNTAIAGNIVVYSPLGGGTVNNVTGVRVGLVIDTQRRRRKNLVESYLYHSLPA